MKQVRPIPFIKFSELTAETAMNKGIKYFAENVIIPA